MGVCSDLIGGKGSTPLFIESIRHRQRRPSENCFTPKEGIDSEQLSLCVPPSAVEHLSSRYQPGQAGGEPASSIAG
jgi:hypothetical protein